jgi:transposase
LIADFVIGVDVHKRNHTFVAINPVGAKVATKSVDATTKGHATALKWARSICSGSRLWAVEDIRGLSTRLESELLDAGEAVVRVPPKLTARQRASARTVGKSDPIDALAIARAVLREPDLPVARHNAYSREIKLLVDRRDDLVGFRTATINRLLGRLHELDPALLPKTNALRYLKTREAIASQLDSHTSLLAQLARDELSDVVRLNETITSIQRHIAAKIEAGAATLLAVPGCGPLTAAKIIGETAGIDRFATEAKFAAYVGVAPAPEWSGSTAGRLRATRSGNRQLNRALYTIAMTQIRPGGRGEVYYRRRISEGDSHAKALRCLKRKLCRVVYSCLVEDAKSQAITGG